MSRGPFFKAAHGPDRRRHPLRGFDPELHDSLLEPLIFEPCAQELAQRVAAVALQQVLETAAGIPAC
jgi:hypothetical protein